MLRLLYCFTPCIVWLTTAFCFTSPGKPVLCLLWVVSSCRRLQLLLQLVWFDLIILFYPQDLVCFFSNLRSESRYFYLDSQARSQFILLDCPFKMFSSVEPGSHGACFSSSAHLQSRSANFLSKCLLQIHHFPAKACTGITLNKSSCIIHLNGALCS